MIGSLVMGRYGATTLWTGCIAVGVVIAIGQLSLGTLRRHPELAV